MPIRFLRTEGFRLSALYAGIFSLSCLALGGFVLVITDHALRDQIIQYSSNDIAAVRNGYSYEGVREAREVVHQLMAGPVSSDFYLLQKDGKAIAGNMTAMPPRIAMVDIPPSAATGNHHVLGVGAFLAPGLYIFAGSDTARLHAVQEHILHVMLGLFAAATLLAVAGGTLVSWSFLRRTDAMARACRAIMDGDLKLRIPVRGTKDPLDNLAEAINEMLSRIGQLMDNLAQVSNDIAHDLRTPVTHLRHRLERARADCRTPEEHAASLETAIAKADEILGLFAALLRIAQIEGGERRAAFTNVDLGALLEQMRELFDPVAEEAHHTLHLAAAPALVIRGDRQLLTQLFSNLIENAVVHTPAGTRITLALRSVDGHAVAQVGDDGPGVPLEEHERLFRRLYRREASRTQPGHGLGLSLALAIAELHGAHIHIVEEGPGMTVEVLFPLVRDVA
ncbi:MAG TPA: ATP-binding protein [Rhizomicrobium sp.]|nr:ATP-binding protein [Rhizomicrobium sp.]